MKKSILIIALFWVGWFDTACQKEGEQSYAPSIIMKKIDSLTLPFGVSCPLYSNGFYYRVHHESEYLYFYNKMRHCIHVFDIKLKQEIMQIPMYQDGPHAIPPGFLGFLPITSNSIIIPAFDHTLYWVNSQGEVMNTLAYGELSGPKPLTPAFGMSRYGTTMIADGDSMLYALQLDAIFNYLHGQNGIEHFALCYTFDLRKRIAKLMPLHFPKALWANGLKELTASWTRADDAFVFAPKHDSRIFVTSDMGTFNKTVEAPSRFMRPFPIYAPEKMAAMTWQEGCIHYLSHGEFLSLLYDPWRKYYYRLFWPGDRFAKDMDDPEDHFQYPPQLGIMVLDTQFNILLDTLLPASTYMHHQYFVGKAGLYLAASHPKYPGLHENQLTFHIFEPVKKH